jgi:hypothetical protein
MSSRKLQSRSCSVDSRASSVQGNLDENSSTDFSQEGGIMTGEVRDSEVITSKPNLGNTSNNAILNQNSNDQPNSISQGQLQDFFNTVMQAIRTESAKQTEEFKKQTALLKTESAKLTSAVESLSSEIKRENENLAKSLTVKSETAQDKIRKDFGVRLNSEILVVSQRIDNVRKDNENEVVKLSSTIDEVYASVSEKIDTDVTQTRETIAQIREYVDDKFRAVSGDMQHEISKVNATLGELQQKAA